MFQLWNTVTTRTGEFSLKVRIGKQENCSCTSHRDHTLIITVTFYPTSKRSLTYNIPSFSVVKVHNTDTTYATNTTNTRFEDRMSQNCHRMDKIRAVGLWWDVSRGQVGPWWDVPNWAMFTNTPIVTTRVSHPANYTNCGAKHAMLPYRSLNVTYRLRR